MLIVGSTDTMALAAMSGAMIASGLVGGYIAGLLGVGGGIVIVPVLYQVLDFMSIPDTVRMHVAVGTSLATIVATSGRSARAHYREGGIDMALLRAWIFPLLVGVLIGSSLSAIVTGQVLELVFAVVAMVVAGYILVEHTLPVASSLPDQPWKSLVGAFIGGVSTLMGIGGGTLSVPPLTLSGYPIRRAVGTAAAIGFLIAVPAALGFALAGWRAEGCHQAVSGS